MEVWPEIRSEAHFASMLYSELTCETVVGSAFLKAVTDRLPGGFDSNAIGTVKSVIVEPNLIRDSWKNKNTRGAVVGGLTAFLEKKYGTVNASEVAQSETSIFKASFWEPYGQGNPYRHITRARCDLLIATDRAALWVELKAASGFLLGTEGKYQQIPTQMRAAEVSHRIFGFLKGLRPINVLVRAQPPSEDIKHQGEGLEGTLVQMCWSDFTKDHRHWQHKALGTRSMKGEA